MPLAGNRSAGNYCAVIHCSSAQGKMKLWGEQLCEIHGVTQKTCCPAPYHLHRFPINKDLRDQWIQWIQRENFVPSSSSRVCSLHFIDGKPSVEHPIPSIALGSLRYKKKMSAAGESIGMEVTVKTEFGTNDYLNLDPEGVEKPQVFSGETVTEMKEDSLSPPPFQHITVSSCPQFYMRVESPVDLGHFLIPEDMMEEELSYAHDYDDPLQGQGNEDRDPLRHSTSETSKEVSPSSPSGTQAG